jgi:hypothetical protein
VEAISRFIRHKRRSRSVACPNSDR